MENEDKNNSKRNTYVLFIAAGVIYIDLSAIWFCCCHLHFIYITWVFVRYVLPR